MSNQNTRYLYNVFYRGSHHEVMARNIADAWALAVEKLGLSYDTPSSELEVYRIYKTHKIH
jgi:hypothetical protein